MANSPLTHEIEAIPEGLVTRALRASDGDAVTAEAARLLETKGNAAALARLRSPHMQ